MRATVNLFGRFIGCALLTPATPQNKPLAAGLDMSLTDPRFPYILRVRFGGEEQVGKKPTFLFPERVMPTKDTKRL